MTILRRVTDLMYRHATEHGEFPIIYLAEGEPLAVANLTGEKS